MPAGSMRRRRQWLVPVVGIGLLLAGLSAPVFGPRTAGFVLAGVLAVLAVARATMPSADAAPFAVRSRWLDAGSAGLLAVLLAVLCVIAPR